MATETVANNESIFDQLFREIEDDQKNNYNNIGINPSATDSNSNTNVRTNPNVAYQAELPTINIDDRNDIVNDSYVEEKDFSSSLPPLGEDIQPNPMRQSWIEPVEISCESTDLSHLSQNSDDNSAEIVTLYEQPPLQMNCKPVASLHHNNFVMDDPIETGKIPHETPGKNGVILRNNAKVTNFFIPSPENNFPNSAYENNLNVHKNHSLTNHTPPMSNSTTRNSAEIPFLSDNEMRNNTIGPAVIESEPNNNIMSNGTAPDKNLQINPTPPVSNVMNKNRVEIPSPVSNELPGNIMGPTVTEYEPNNNIMSTGIVPDQHFPTNNNHEQKSPDLFQFQPNNNITSTGTPAGLHFQPNDIHEQKSADLLDFPPNNNSSLPDPEGVTLNSVQRHTQSETRNPLHLPKEEDIPNQLLAQNNAIDTTKLNVNLPENNNTTKPLLNTSTIPSNQFEDHFVGSNTNQGQQFIALSQNEPKAMDNPSPPKNPPHSLSENSQTVQMVKEEIGQEQINFTDKENIPKNDRDLHKSLSAVFKQREDNTKSPPPWSHFGSSGSSFNTDATEEPVEIYSNDDLKDQDLIVPRASKKSSKRCYKISLLLILFVSIAGIVVGAIYVPSAFKSLSRSDDAMPTVKPFLETLETPSISPSFYPSVVPSSSQSPSTNLTSYPSVVPSSFQNSTTPKQPTSKPTLRKNSLNPNSTKIPSNLPSSSPSRMPTLRKPLNTTTSNISTHPTVTPTISYLPSVSIPDEIATFSQVGFIRGLPGEGIGASVSMSIDGKRMVVGAHRWNTGSNPGVVRVYEYMTEYIPKVSLWILVAELRGEADDMSFGFSVAISGDGSVIAIGVPGYSINLGKVLVYKVQDDSRDDWLEIGQIFGSSSEESLGMDISLSHNGDQMAIGAPHNNLSTGKVYVYQNRDGAGWKFDGNQTIIGNIDDDFFGYSVSISLDGTQIVVGAPQKHESKRLGYVSIYEKKQSSGQWVNIGSLSNNFSEVHDDGFGYSIAQSLNGTRILIGSPRYMNGTGLVQMYEKDHESKNWSIVYEAVGPSTNSSLGYSVDISSNGSVMAITSPGIYKVEMVKLDSGHVKNIVIDENNLTEDYRSVISISKNGTYMSLGSPQLSTVQIYQLEWWDN